MPPCMIDVVQSVRIEREKGWSGATQLRRERANQLRQFSHSVSVRVIRNWNYQEGVCLIALCWYAVMLHHSQLAPVPVPAAPPSLVADLDGKSVRVRFTMSESKSDESSTHENAQPESHLLIHDAPELMRVQCAKVLYPAILKELADREPLQTPATVSLPPAAPESDIIQEANTDMKPSAPSSSSNKRRAPAPADAADGDFDDSSLRLPLPQHPPPRSYPEVCTFCQNLSFFSAIYASTGHQPAASASNGPVVPFTKSATAFHLCCTSCLVKYLRLRIKYHDRSNKKRKTSALASVKKAKTFATAGVLPSDTQKENNFYSTFRQSLKRHARWWRIAYIGVRVTEEQLKFGEAASKYLLPSIAASPSDGSCISNSGSSSPTVDAADEPMMPIVSADQVQPSSSAVYQPDIANGANSTVVDAISDIMRRPLRCIIA